MTKTKTAGPLVPFVPAAPTAEGWGTCPGTGCMQERRTEYGKLAPHRRWHTWYQRMVPCDGGGRAPLKVTT